MRKNWFGKADVIQDINITPKQCPAIRDAITTNKESIAQHDATVSNAFNPGAPLLRNALVSQLEAQNLRYQRECVR